MNMIELQDQLKNFSQDQLISEMQAPSGSAPQYMVLSEINRRKRMKESFAAQQAKAGAATTVAEEVVASAGVPQAGLPQMAAAMAPKRSMAQNTGINSLPVQGPMPSAQQPMQPQGMYAGGPVRRMAEGGLTSDPALKALAERRAQLAEDDHRRVREASLRSRETLRMRFKCEPAPAVDVIGLFVLLPAPVL